MNRHKLGDKIAQEALTGSDPSCTRLSAKLQKQPYTAVEIEHHFQANVFYAVGFSKVSRPDIWDEQRGLEMAVLRAARDIARQVLMEVG